MSLTICAECGKGLHHDDAIWTDSEDSYHKWCFPKTREELLAENAKLRSELTQEGAAEWRITSQDQRIGIGVGGWSTLVTVQHVPSGIAVTYPCGAGRRSPHQRRQVAMQAIELLRQELSN